MSKKIYGGFSSVVFRSRALKYCKLNGLLSSSLGLRDKDLHSMIVSHAGHSDISKIFESIPALVIKRKDESHKRRLGIFKAAIIGIEKLLRIDLDATQGPHVPSTLA